MFSLLIIQRKNADFRGKSNCKRIVVNAVGHKHDNDRQTLMNLYNDFNQFREIHISVYIASVWKFPTNCSARRPDRFVVKLISSVSNNNKDTEDNTTQKTALQKKTHYTKVYTRQKTTLHLRHHYTKHNTAQKTTLHRRHYYTEDKTT